METKFSDIPVVQKFTISKPVAVASSSCCAPKNNAVECCTPSTFKREKEGACCAQPSDGSSCCDK